MARKTTNVENLKFLIKIAGGKQAFLQKTTITPSNLSDYLRGAKPISQARLEREAHHIFDVNREALALVVKWSGSRANFIGRTKIKSSGLANYLNGKNAVSEKTLKKYLEKYFGNEHIDPLFELAPLSSSKGVPNDSGLYALYDSSKKLLYFGKASRLKAEMNQTLNRPAPKQLWALAPNKATYRQPKFKEMVTYFSVYKVTPDSSELRHHLESFVLRVVLNSTMNQRTGKLKVR